MAKRITIKLESENYRYFLNFQIKEECESKEKISEMVLELNKFFDFKITQIYHELPDGRPLNYYKISDYNDLPSDSDNMTADIFNVNKDICDRLYIIHNSDNVRRRCAEMQKLFSKYFFAYNRGGEIETISWYQNKSVNFKFRKNKSFSGFHGLPHSNAYGSDIEKILGEALKKSGIEFITQQQILHNLAVLTVPDFFIEKCMLAIYCDGFQYHYNKESVIKDRSQDRILQYLGYKVLRYTGSEIVGDVDKCISEIKKFMQKFITNP